MSLYNYNQSKVDTSQPTREQVLDERLCRIWFDDPTITPEQVGEIFARFATKYGRWPSVRVGAKGEVKS